MECRFPRRPAEFIYAKAENLNMTGSIKDRMALHILREAYERGVLRPGAPIVEATSGNTGHLVRARSAARWATRSRSSCRTG
ncbi:MAG: pyridoxal-phosphate dependent enzyme [Rhodopseudomonas palustris]|nr:pyridoxal-phosphate dependent enzyme [Rhodopseudomonas palustris]